jgi:hypothetical protein
MVLIFSPRFHHLNNHQRILEFRLMVVNNIHFHHNQICILFHLIILITITPIVRHRTLFITLIVINSSFFTRNWYWIGKQFSFPSLCKPLGQTGGGIGKFELAWRQFPFPSLIYPHSQMCGIYEATRSPNLSYLKNIWKMVTYGSESTFRYWVEMWAWL